MKHNIDLIKQIREAYAKEEGYKSFANMALNVNIVPRDITEIAKRYAEGINSELQAKIEKYEKALKSIIAMDGHRHGKFDINKVANEALSGEGEKEARQKQFTFEEIDSMLMEFALLYHRNPHKDIANDAAEYLHDKANQKEDKQ